MPRWTGAATFSHESSVCNASSGKANARLARNGKDSYKDDTHIRLSPDAPDTWRNIFTGEEIEVETRIDQPILAFRNLVGYFPVRLFEAASRS
jgi:hypothetical protein